jgi:hypothetical protein
VIATPADRAASAQAGRTRPGRNNAAITSGTFQLGHQPGEFSPQHPGVHVAELLTIRIKPKLMPPFLACQMEGSLIMKKYKVQPLSSVADRASYAGTAPPTTKI